MTQVTSSKYYKTGVHSSKFAHFDLSSLTEGDVLSQQVSRPLSNVTWREYHLMTHTREIVFDVQSQIPGSIKCLEHFDFSIRSQFVRVIVL